MHNGIHTQSSKLLQKFCESRFYALLRTFLQHLFRNMILRKQLILKTLYLYQHFDYY